MTSTTKPASPAFAVRVRPKFREVRLPPGPAPLVRDRAVPGAAGPAEAAPPDPGDPDRAG